MIEVASSNHPGGDHVSHMIRASFADPGALASTPRFVAWNQ
jgi:hypothetical protein